VTKVHFPVVLLALVVAFVLIPTSVSAGSNTSVQNGDRYYDIGGDHDTSLIYPNGIVLSSEKHSGFARWEFTIDPVPPTYNLSAGLYYSENSETLGDGPSISLYNWTSSRWDSRADNVGIGSDVSFTTYAPSMNYISSTGSVRVDVYADRGELIDVGTVSVAWEFDFPPSNPSSNTSTPSTGTWTSDNTIEVTWFGAADDYGVAGYSLLWSQSSPDLPDTTIDTTGTSNTSLPLADGIWYLHIRTVDIAGNWNATAYDVGPFMVDTTPPAAPDVQGPPAWSNVTSPEFTWIAPADLSDISGYSYSMDGLPDDIVDTTTQNVVWTTLLDGSHTFHVKACDQANNWGSPASYSFSLDTVLPTITIDSPADGAIQNSSTVDVGWTGNDALSGIGHYEVQIDSGSPINVGTSTSYPFVDVPDGNHIVNVIVFDLAGNQRNATVSFMVDTTAPAAPDVQGPPAWSNITTPEFTWTAPGNSSGISGYSYSMDSLPDDVIDTTSQSVIWPAALADGAHTFYIKACNQANNWGVPASYPFSLDTVQPSVGIISPTDGAIQNTSTVDMSWSGSDALSGIDHYEVQIDSGSPIILGTALSYQFVGVADGSHTLKVTAVDKAGNQNSASVSVVVDTVAPQTVLSIEGTLGSNGWYVTPVNVTITSTDATSGVKSIMYNLDSAGWQSFTAKIPISANGVHSIQFYAEDNATNRDPVSSVDIKIDTTQLYLVFNVQNGTIFNLRSVVISWTVYNNLSGLDHFEYSLDGGAFQSLGTTSSVGLGDLSEGSHVLVVKAFDNAGDVAERSITFIVDTLPPSLAFDVQNGTMFTSRPVIINWTSDDNNTGIDRFEYSLDGGVFVSNGNTTSLSLADVSDGSRILRVRAYDNAGNIAERSLSFMVDTQPPVLAFTTQGVAYFNTRSVAITWTASDAASGIDRFEYSLDNGVFMQFGTPTSVRLDLADVAEGTHFLALRAYDRGGNLAERSLTFVVDIQPPTLAFYIQNGTAFAFRPVAINWSSADSNSGIARFEYALDNAPWVTVGTSTTVNLADVSEGAHILTVRAYDRAGNIARMSVEFVVDTQPPSLAFDVPDGAFYNSTSATITWSSSDEVSGVAYFTYRLDMSDFRAIGDNRSVDLVGLSDTTHVLTVRAYDRVGNYVERSLAFLVDTRPPILTLDIQDGASFSSSTVTITWLSQDSGSGIDRYEYSLDDGSFKSVGSVMSVDLTGLTDGTHVLTIRAIDQTGNIVEKTVTFQVNASGPLLFIAVMILNAIVISAVVIGWKMVKGKRR
jgi:large repetitive protein